MHDEPIDHDFDAFWKESLDAFLGPFLELVAPHIHAAIDWTKPVTPLDKELQALFPDGRKGRRFVDALFRVTLRDGTETEILIHIEVQADPDPRLPRRMYVYRYRLYEKRRRPVVSIAVLADDDPTFRPTCYEEDVLGTKLRFDFPTVKLLDFRDRIRALERDPNPFALLVVAWLRTRATEPGRRRLQFKRRLFRLLRERGGDRDQMQRVFRLLDWLMRLPEARQGQFTDEAVRLEEGEAVKIVSPSEELFLMRAKRDDIVEFLTGRFGPVPDALAARVRAVRSIPELDRLVSLAATATSVETFEAGLPVDE